MSSPLKPTSINASPSASCDSNTQPNASTTGSSSPASPTSHSAMRHERKSTCSLLSKRMRNRSPETSSYTLLRNERTRPAPRDQQEADDNSDVDMSDASDSDYLAHEPCSPLTPTSSSTLSPAAEMAPSADESVQTMASQARASPVSAPLSPVMECAQLGSDAVMSSPPLSARGQAGHAFEAQQSAVNDDNHGSCALGQRPPAGRMVRNVTGGTGNQQSGASAQSAGALSTSASTSQPFVLQPVPSTRKRRRVIQEGAEVTTTQASCAQAESEHHRNKENHDSHQVTTPPVEPPLRKLTALDGARAGLHAHGHRQIEVPGPSARVGVIAAQPSAVGGSGSSNLQMRPALAPHAASSLPNHAPAAAASHAQAMWANPIPTPENAIIQPSFYPPITRQTLRELDLSEMLKNQQLRHDVVFDPHVQFRPNFEGERGRKVRESADQYWAAVAREIANGCTCLRFEKGVPLPCACPPENLRASKTNGVEASPSCRASGPYIATPARIPILVHELRSILLSILPPASAFVSQMATPNAMAMHTAMVFATSTSSGGAPSSSSSSSGQARNVGGNNSASGGGGGSGTRAWAGPGSLASGTAQPLGTSSQSHMGASSPSASNPLMTQERMASQHSLVVQMLDPVLITQEVRHGVLNLEGSIRFLAKVLKLHCAPMRDEVVERMVHVVCEEGDVVRGLRMCFEVLELMKLDIANHQLRSARPWLVETAVDFEVRWFRDQIDHQKLFLHRTKVWFTYARQLARQKLSHKPEVEAMMPRKEFISRAFNEGFLHLLFDAPGTLPLAELMAIGRAGMASGIAPSSSSLNQAYTGCYPETFQLDAYRLITFHNDITDLTVVYMFLLLFRQLACAPLEDDAVDGMDQPEQQQEPGRRQASPAAIRAQAALLASNELGNMKSRIWCLLNEANARVGVQSKLGGFTPRTNNRTAQQGNGSGNTTAASPALVYGSVKFENAIWQDGVKDVLLQVAAHATAVQKAARHAANVVLGLETKSTMADVDMDTEGRTAFDEAKDFSAARNPPSQRVLTMLNAWMDTNLRVHSPLHKLCQSRLREVVLAILVDRLAGSPPASTATAVAVATAAIQRKQQVAQRALRISKSDSTSTSTTTPSSSFDSTPLWSGVPVSARKADEMEAGSGSLASPAKRLKTEHPGSSAELPSADTSPLSTSSSTASSLASAALSGHSLAQQQAISLRRLLRKTQAEASSGATPASTTPSTPLSALSFASTSVPQTPIPRSPLWTTSSPEERDWPSALTRSGLEPFAAEVRLLGDRIATLAAFHLRVFRNLYERLDVAERAASAAGGGAVQGDASSSNAKATAASSSSSSTSSAAAAVAATATATSGATAAATAAAA